ncbi:MAG: dependent ligase [Gammaproteobacteria bacterium]|nr:dependent ligase [Gammaproteobacteria bacterium]
MATRVRNTRSTSVKPTHADAKLRFIASMECEPVATLPEGPKWTYEIKLDGFRLEAIKSAAKTRLYSRRGNLLNDKFPYIAAALSELPNSTVLDGEVVALDGERRSDFYLLQNFRSAETRIHYYAFDILVSKGKRVMQLPLESRREILADVLPRNEHISLSVVDRRPLAHMLEFAKEHGLEGIVAKNIDSEYEPGKRSGQWRKHRINEGQEFVVGGYTPGAHGFDALIVGYYRGPELLFAARVRAGFVPASRGAVFSKIERLKTSACPFANLPEASAGRWDKVSPPKKCSIACG